MRSTALVPLILVAALGAASGPAQAATDSAIADAVSDGAGWVESRQDPASGSFNPGFSSFDPTPTALAPAGRNAADVARGAGPSLQDAIFAALSDPGDANHPSDAGSFGNAILSGYAAGIDPARVSASQNLAADLGSTYTGGYFGDPNVFGNVAVGAIALSRVGAPRFLLDRTVAVIRDNQHDDGGWSFGQSTTPDTQDDPSDVDLTGVNLAALCESGVRTSEPVVQGALAFLKSRVVPASGAIVSPGPFGSENASSTGWAVSGLNACGIDPQGAGFNAGKTPIDYLLGLQDNSGGADDGSFLYSEPPPPFAPGPDLPSSRDALRALAGAGFTAEPPAREDPADPRKRAVPAVADGVSVPIALAVDDGAGAVTFCRVTVPSGSSLAALLATANGASTPGGCATGAEFSAGQLSRLNGQSGSWAYSVNGGSEQIAAGQAVRFGDFVALRRTSGTLPATPAAAGLAGTSSGAGAPAVAAAVQARAIPARLASRSLKISRRKRVVSVSVRCAKASRLCQGVVYLKYRKRTLARRAFLIRGGRTTKLNVKLSKRAIRRLGRSKKRIRVNLFSRDGAGIASTSTRTVILRTSR